MLLDSTCYADCPLNYANNFAEKRCDGCQTGCDRCDVKNLTKCELCSADLFLYNDTCSGSCPEGWKGKNRVCVNESDDLRVLYFPFLIAAFIFTIVVFFGLLKKKAVLVNGTMKKISNQWSVSAIIACVSLLQTLAVIVQFILALVYAAPVVFVLTLLIFLAMLGFHIYWLVWYTKTYHKTNIPAIGARIVHKGKQIDIETEAQALKYPQPVDKLFRPWANKHVVSTYAIFALTVVHFKVTKMFYSRFYMFDMFKAHWEGATMLRERQEKIQYIYLGVVDSLLIIIGIVGLALVGLVVNQLWITLIETIVLSIYLIILQFIEKYYIKRIFEYTEKDDKNKTSEAMKKYAGKKGKKMKMNNLFQKIKSTSSKSFHTKKWDNLMEYFGGRRCKSMIELSTGWPTEEDPRHVKTWPISRDLEHEMEAQGLKKFTADDAYALQDNCYAEGVHKLKGKDKNIQGDAAKLEFQSALNRKHGDLMAREDEVDEMHTRKGVRRRGRKNKYHNQIDLEDDQEIDPDEASDKDADLQVIKEQEEEEEALRKMVQESSKKQQEVTQARTQRIQQERLTREQREERTQGELKLKQ
jgi:hypothetical protein